MIKVLKILCHGHLIENLNGEETVRMFQNKEKQKRNNIEFRSRKVNKRKGGKLCIKWKGYDNSFGSYIDKKISLYKMSYYPEPYTHSKNQIKK